MNNPQPLAGLRLLIPRAQARGASLQQAVTALGGQARCIAALRFDATLAPIRSLAQAGEAQAAVFTSQPAVEHWQRLATPADLPPRVMAVGDATAAALHRAGVDAVRVPPRQDADGILAELDAHDWRDVLLVTGVGGRPLLRQALAQRGRLRLAEVYARRPHPDLTDALAALGDWPNVVLASSAETYRAIIEHAPDDGRGLLHCPVVAPSERVIQHSRTLGSEAPAWLATPFGEAAVLSALKANWVRPSPPSARDDDRERR